VYSYHKTATRAYILKKCATEWKHLVKNVKVLAQMKFEIPKSYRFHKKEAVSVDVDLYRFEIFQSQ
jgi:rRNA N6-adenosine-methyltransferase METTL5